MIAPLVSNVVPFTRRAPRRQIGASARAVRIASRRAWNYDADLAALERLIALGFKCAAVMSAHFLLDRRDDGALTNAQADRLEHLVRDAIERLRR